MALGRQVVKVGVASVDWSTTLADFYGQPVHGGANWIRFGQAKPEIAHNLIIGVPARTTYGLAVKTFDGQVHSDCAVIVLQRCMEDWVPDAVAHARSNGQIILNDVDDWFWGLHPANVASTVVDPENNPTSNIDHYAETLKASTLVTVSTPFLANSFQQWGIETRMICNGVQAWVFPRRIHHKGIPVIGWCGSTAHRSGDLEIVAPALRAMQKTARFHHTGHIEWSDSFALRTGLHPKNVSTLPLLTPAEYPFGFEFDIGIVPLNDVSFNEAKSWIKGIEYAAAGIPFVASNVGEYRRLHNKYGIGRLATTTEDWLRHFDELSDPAVRVEEGGRNREIVMANLTSRHMAREWEELIWELIG